MKLASGPYSALLDAIGVETGPVRKTLLFAAAIIGCSLVSLDHVGAGDDSRLRYTCRETRIGNPEFKGKKLLVLEQVHSEPFIDKDSAVTIRRFVLNLFDGRESQANEELLNNTPVQFSGDARYLQQSNRVSFISDRNRLMETNVVSLTIKRDQLSLSRYVGIGEQFYVACIEEIVTP